MSKIHMDDESYSKHISEMTCLVERKLRARYKNCLKPNSAPAAISKEDFLAAINIMVNIGHIHIVYQKYGHQLPAPETRRIKNDILTAINAVHEAFNDSPDHSKLVPADEKLHKKAKAYIQKCKENQMLGNIKSVSSCDLAPHEQPRSLASCIKWMDTILTMESVPLFRAKLLEHVDDHYAEQKRIQKRQALAKQNKNLPKLHIIKRSAQKSESELASYLCLQLKTYYKNVASPSCLPALRQLIGQLEVLSKPARPKASGRIIGLTGPR